MDEDAFEAVPVVRIESPCINLCRLGADGLCDGCHRTRAEIGGWSGGTAAWRAAVMAQLPGRRPSR